MVCVQFCIWYSVWRLGVWHFHGANLTSRSFVFSGSMFQIFSLFAVSPNLSPSLSWWDRFLPVKGWKICLSSSVLKLGERCNQTSLLICGRSSVQLHRCAFLISIDFLFHVVHILPRYFTSQSCLHSVDFCWTYQSTLSAQLSLLSRKKSIQNRKDIENSGRLTGRQ